MPRKSAVQFKAIFKERIAQTALLSLLPCASMLLLKN